MRGLGLFAAVSINIANMIGTGIFLKTRVMTCNVGTPGLVLLVWIVAGLLALAGALTYSELAAMMPDAGGGYVFLREAYGRRWGFLYGWTLFFVARTGSQAALAVGSAIFLNIVTGGALNGPYRLQAVALVFIWIITLLNCASVKVSGAAVSLLTVIKASLVLGVGAGAVLFAKGDWGHLLLANLQGTCEGVVASARGGFAGFGAAMLGALWAYDGWENVAPLAGEVKNPRRNIPLAFIGGMFVVGGLYIFVNSAYFYVLTPTEIASVSSASSVASAVASRFLGPAAVVLIGVALLTSSVGALHSSILANSRTPFAMARDGLFFKGLSRISPGARVPRNALLAQGAWASVLALSGSYDVITDYVIFASWLLYGMTAASVFVFRRRYPNAERPYRTWGYPVVPVLFLLVTGWLLVNTLITNPQRAFMGLLLMILGLPFYEYWSRRSS